MRKLRTRQHVLEDLSYNFVEKQILLSFSTFIRYPPQEYSYDALVRTFNEQGEIEPDVFFIQVKATDNISYSQKYKGYRLKLEKRDMELWLAEIWPVLVVLYDGKSDIAYYVELHEYFKENKLILKNINRNKTIF